MSVSSHLTARELLVKGLEKTERILPAKGAKSVTPKGSWIEQKEIQEALESRKQLLSDERVEKWGSLCRAEWDPERGLARVTEQRGPYWSYLGHVVEKQLYLYPEEALHLMELNCLELKYCGITMSLQQAYAMLLRNDIRIREYRVYSELSRAGYKILRTIKPEMKDFQPSDEGKITDNHTVIENQVNTSVSETEDEVSEVLHIDEKSQDINNCESNVLNKSKKDNNIEYVEKPRVKNSGHTGPKPNETITEIISSSLKEISRYINLSEDTTVGNSCVAKEKIDITEDNALCKEDNVSDKTMSETLCTCDEENTEMRKDSLEIIQKANHADENVQHWRNVPVVMLEGPSLQNKDNICLKNKKRNKLIPTENNQDHSLLKLKNQIKSLASLNLPDYFQNIANIIGCRTVTVTPPEEDFVPRHVFLHKNSYTLNLAEIISKQNQNHSATDFEIEQTTRTQIRDDPVREEMFQQQQNMMKQFTSSFFAPNMNFQPRFSPSVFHRHQFFFPPFPIFIPQQRFNIPKHNYYPPQENESSNRRLEHLRSIRRIAFRLKRLKKSGELRGNNYLYSLQRLIAAFNSRYNENLKITENITLLNDCEETDMVTLDDDDEPRSKKKRKQSPKTDNSDRIKLLERIKTTAFKLKQLRNEGEHCFRNCRSLKEAIKAFNKKFNMSIILTADFKIVDTKQIIVDSSSDSDCVIAEKETGANENKKEPVKTAIIPLAASTSKVPTLIETQVEKSSDFYSLQSSNFSKWLPDSRDWGRAEVTPSLYSQLRIVKSNQVVFIYDYLEACRTAEFNDWEHLKASFWSAVEKNCHVEEVPMEVSRCEPLLSPDDCVDLQTALERVRFIEGFSDAEQVETDLRVVFDVHERDVKNLKKSKPPVPSFRIVCLDEREPVPAVSQVLSLANQHEDRARLVLAVVGAAVSYVVITANELPVYVKKPFI